MLADPEGPVTRPTLAGAARERALRGWARGPVGANDPTLFSEYVARHAARTPDAVAIAHGAETTTYRELDESASRLADRLAALGVTTETVVGICAERGPWQVRAALAVLRSGGTYLPLDPTYPTDRLAYMADDSGMRVLITQAELVGTVPYAGPTVLLESEMDGPSVPHPVPDLDNAAYLFYTSGSTGRPKGVVVPHRGMVNLMHAQRDTFAPVPGDHVLQFASFNFDVSVHDIVLALANGARLCTAPTADLRPGPDLANTIRAHGVTVATLPPSALAVLEGEEFPTVRLLCAGGEAPTEENVTAFAPGRSFYNCYGPTEASVWTHLTRCEPGGGRPPIGLPMRNLRAYVLDHDHQPMPVGAIGELYVGGESLARGYLNRPGLTAAAFVPDPHGGAGERLFRTGDLARQHADGAVEWLGRRDSQVKLRGFRIELGEIEHELRALPDVRQAVVLLRSDLPSEPALVAYVVPRPGADRDARVLREALRTTVPAHMVPTWFVFLDALPLNRSEKVDRGALPPPAVERPDLGADYVAPRTAAETTLAEVWSAVLGVARVGVHDDFYLVGGSSLSTVRVAAMANARGVPISVRDLVEVPTIAQLAERAARGATREIRSEVRLRDGDGAPLYCVHPSGGSATWYVPLARALPPGTPVVGFQARGLLGGVDPVTVPEIAANYVAELAERDGTGPHAVLGWSLGGNLVLEMANQLLRRGHRVDPLVLIEPYLPNADNTRRLTGVGRDLLSALPLRDELRRQLLLAPSPRREELASELTAVLLGAGMRPDEANLVENAPIEVWHSLLTAMAGYQVRPYAGHVHLVVGREAASLPDGVPMPGLDMDYRGYLDRWRALALGGLTVHVVPGDHMSMLTEPNVRELAALLGTIQEVQEVSA